jgi:hypothetical protein
MSLITAERIALNFGRNRFSSSCLNLRRHIVNGPNYYDKEIFNLKAEIIEPEKLSQVNYTS